MSVGAIKSQLQVSEVLEQSASMGSSCALQSLFAPGEDGSCGAGIAAGRSWEERILDGCFGCTGMADVPGAI